MAYTLPTVFSYFCALQQEKDQAIHVDYPSDLPYLCLDATYMYSFLVDGFGIAASTKYVMEKNIKVNGKEFVAAWSLGMATEILSY